MRTVYKPADTVPDRKRIWHPAAETDAYTAYFEAHGQGVITMARNAGKVFEDDFKASVPDDVYFVRLHDAALGFDVKHSTQRFSLKSPYDAILCKNIHI